MQPCFVNIFFGYSKKFLLSTFWSYFAKFCGEFLTYSCENSLLAKYLRLLSAGRAPYFSSISKIFLFIALAFIGNMIYNIYSVTNMRAEARDLRSMYDQISNWEKPHISAAIQPGVGPEKPADPWPLLRHALSVSLGLTKMTITNIVNDLLDRNIVIEVDCEVSSGASRKAGCISLNPGVLYGIGVHVYRDSVCCSIVDIAGNLLERRETVLNAKTTRQTPDSRHQGAYRAVSPAIQRQAHHRHRRGQHRPCGLQARRGHLHHQLLRHCRLEHRRGAFPPPSPCRCM